MSREIHWAERQMYDVTIFAAGPRESATRIIALSRLSNGGWRKEEARVLARF